VLVESYLIGEYTVAFSIEMKRNEIDILFVFITESS